MSENLDNVQSATVEAPVEQPVFDIKAAEAFAFGGPEPAAEAPVIEPAAQAAAPATEPIIPAASSDEQVYDANDYVKQTFGFDNVEAAKAAIEELRALKATPPTVNGEFKYPDDETKRIADAILNKKFKELRQYSEAQEMLSGVDGLNLEQQVKLKLKLENPLFDSEMIEDEFKELYTVNEESCQNEDGEIDPMKLRKTKIKVQQNLERAGAGAKDFFAQYKTKIELPSIQTTATQQQVTIDEDYEAYKTSAVQQAEKYDKVIIPTINSIKESDLAMSFKVNDENNQMNFDLAIQVDPNDLASAKNDAAQFGDFLKREFWDGEKFLGDKIMQFILSYKNQGKYAQTVARQAVNAERRRVIEKETDTGTSSQRDYNVNQPKNEQLAELEEFAFGGR